MSPTPVSWDGLDSHGQPLTWDSPEFIWDGFLPTPTPQPPKHMPQLRVLLGFTAAPDHALEETAGAVIDGLYANPAFPTPPVAKPALQAALTAFTNAIAAQTNGGPAATAMKNNMREALIDLLRQLAGYVQEASDNDRGGGRESWWTEGGRVGEAPLQRLRRREHQPRAIAPRSADHQRH